MIRSVVTFLNRFTRYQLLRQNIRVTNTSPTAIVQGRDFSSLQQKLQENYERQRKAFLAQQAFKVKVANMGPTEGKLFTLHKQWNNREIDMTIQQYVEATEKLEDQLQAQRQERSRRAGHI